MKEHKFRYDFYEVYYECVKCLLCVTPELLNDLPDKHEECKGSHGRN